MTERIEFEERQVLKLKDGTEYRVEGYWDEIRGKSWKDSEVFAASHYGMKVGRKNLPMDNEVLYGKVDGIGHLMHISEIDPESF